MRKHKKTITTTKPKPIIIKLQDTCRIRLGHELIITILKTKDITEAHYNNLYLEQKIKLYKEHITVDDLYENNISQIFGV